MVYIIWAIIISIMVAGVVRLLFNLPTPPGDKIILRRLEEVSSKITEETRLLSRSTLTQLVGPAKLIIKQKPINYLIDALKKSPKSAKYESQILAADLDSQILAEDFFGVKVLLALVLSLIALSNALGNGVFGLFFLGIAAFSGYLLPNFFLTGAADERQTKIRKVLPDAIDLLVIGMEAGLGFDRALRLYCDRFKGPLSEEFKKMMAEIDIGQTRRQALTNLAKRNDLEDLNLFVSSILQAEKLGTPMTTVLALQSKTARTRHRQWVQEMSAKAPIKILFPLAGLILPALFAVLFGPVVIKMIQGG